VQDHGQFAGNRDDGALEATDLRQPQSQALSVEQAYERVSKAKRSDTSIPVKYFIAMMPPRTEGPVAIAIGVSYAGAVDAQSWIRVATPRKEP
jgi:hypothetical protein